MHSLMMLMILMICTMVCTFSMERECKFNDGILCWTFTSIPVRYSNALTWLVGVQTSSFLSELLFKLTNKGRLSANEHLRNMLMWRFKI